MSTDSEIIEKSILDPEAFGELYLRHASVVHRYSWRRAGESVADDVTAETFLVAFTSRERFDSSRADAKPWLLGIATRLLHNHARAEARRLRAFARSAEADVLDDPTARSGERMDAVTSMEVVTRTLRKMSATDRDCLLLYTQGDLTYEEVAEAMDTPVGTIRSRLNRARKTLREAISPAAIEQEASHGRTDAFPYNA